MKCGIRFLLCSGIVAVTGLLFCWSLLADLESQYGAVEYLTASVEHLLLESSGPQVANVGGKTGDKIIVMAKLEAEHTNWVEEELSE